MYSPNYPPYDPKLNCVNLLDLWYSVVKSILKIITGERNGNHSSTLA